MRTSAAWIVFALASAWLCLAAGCTDNELTALSPDIDVDPLEIDYGTVAVGVVHEVVLAVDNLGGATLTVDSVVMEHGDAGFSVEAYSGEIVPDGHVPLAVRFEPVGLGPAEDVILITSDDPDEPLVEVPVWAVDVVDQPDIEVDPVEVDFGNAALESTQTEVVTIANVGTSDLDLIGCVISGDPAFSITVDPSPALLGPGEVVELEVSFTPHELLLYAGVIDVLSDDPDEPVVPVTLSGGGSEGTPPSATITSPQNGAFIASTYQHDMAGTVYDVEDPLETLYVEWTSDIDGLLSAVAPDAAGNADLGPWALSPGVHELMLEVVDSDNMSGHDFVTVTVCEMAASGTLQVEDGGHIQATITSTSAAATNRLYIVQPVNVTMTLDANNDVGVHVDMGYFDPCTQIVFRLESSVDGYAPHDSDTSSNFQITQIAPNHWTIGVEDGADSDYNDIVIDVQGGL